MEVHNLKDVWLIRTHQNQILGPITKEKIIELLEKKSLDKNDEICPGNGHWFFVREVDLINRFVFGDEVVSGVKEEDSLDITVVTRKSQSQSEKEVLLPRDKDLEFPDIEKKK